MNSGWAHPENPDDPNDILASRISMSLYLGWWAYPIYGTDGNYLQLMKDTLSDEGEWNEDWNLTDDQMKIVKGSSDFFGLNHYGSDVVKYDEKAKYKHVKMPKCKEWPTTGSSWLGPVPWAFRELLKFIHQEFDSSKYPIFVTENGLSSKDMPGIPTNGTDFDPNLNDQFRINFYKGINRNPRTSTSPI